MSRKEAVTFLSENPWSLNISLKVIETNPVAMEGENYDRYVTLSHCWGTAQNVTKLTVDTAESFRTRGVPFKTLSTTFRDAILFAVCLEKVGYIWIDSLCIIQKGGETADTSVAENDWREQSRSMDRIYGGSYLNISATAASSGDTGLFVPRTQARTWEGEICSNEGLTGSPASVKLVRITKKDFWADVVDNAPVNRRGWVLQERIMSPRVLHFCDTGIAWECRERIDAEEYPEGVAMETIEASRLIPKATIKTAMLPNDHKPRGTILKQQEMPNYLVALDWWKQVVELYSKAGLTVLSDKLVAISGIASATVDSFDCDYVAGMWRKDLEDQLLWYVNQDDMGPASHRVPNIPSFSWASIHTTKGISFKYRSGFKYMPLLFKVERCEIRLADELSPFGSLEHGRIWLRIQDLSQYFYDGRIWKRFDPHLFHGFKELWQVDGIGELLLDVGWDEMLAGHDQDPEIYLVPAKRRLEPTRMICFILRYIGMTSTEHKEYQRIGLVYLDPYARDGDPPAPMRPSELHERNQLISIV